MRLFEFLKTHWPDNYPIILTAGFALCMPVVIYLTNIQYPFHDPAAVMMIVGGFILGLSLGVVLGFWLILRFVMLSAGIVIFGYYFSLFLVGVGLGAVGDFLLGPNSPFGLVPGQSLGTIFLVSMALVVFALGAALVILKDNALKVFSAALGATILGFLILPSEDGPLLLRKGEFPADRAELPPVLIFVLDGQIGLNGLPMKMTEAQDARVEILQTFREFQVFQTSYSRYALTFMSLASAFNFTEYDDFPPVTHRSNGYVLQSNRLADNLRGKGYQVAVYQTDHLDLCADITTYCVTAKAAATHEIRNGRLGFFERLDALLTAMLRRHGLGVQSLSYTAPTLFRLMADDFKADLTGVAVVFHVLLPHGPFVYDGNCDLQFHKMPYFLNSPTRQYSPRRNSYVWYFRQQQCVFRQLEDVFNGLRKSGDWRNSTIVVMGDHGSRITGLSGDGDPLLKITGKSTVDEIDINDIFSTFFAIKRPDLLPGIKPGPIEIQQALAYFFGASNRLTLDRPPIVYIGPWTKNPKSSDFEATVLPVQYDANNQEE